MQGREHHICACTTTYICTYHQATTALDIPLTVCFTLYDLVCMNNNPYTSQIVKVALWLTRLFTHIKNSALSFSYNYACAM